MLPGRKEEKFGTAEVPHPMLRSVAERIRRATDIANEILRDFKASVSEDDNTEEYFSRAISDKPAARISDNRDILRWRAGNDLSTLETLLVKGLSNIIFQNVYAGEREKHTCEW